jgi:Zn-dependent protease with chaperone function
MFILVALLAFVLAWAYTTGTNHLALNPWRKSVQAHWTERARILFPVRKSAGRNIWFIPINCALASWIFLPENNLMLPFVFSAALIGAILGSYGFDHELFPRFTFWFWLQYVTVIWVLRVGFFGFLVFAAVFMPDTFDWRAFVFGFASVSFLISLHFGLWTWLLEKTGLLIPPSQRLSEIAKQSSEKSGIKYRSLWLLRSPVGYAAALPATGGLIFSEGLLSAHPDSEISSICAHELAHLGESRWTIGLRVLSSLWLAPIIFVRPVTQIFGGSEGILLLLLPGLILITVAKRLGRRMEVRADIAAKDHQLEAGVYASALERLYEWNHMPAVMPGNRMIHPHLYDRLLAAGVTPAYPRPAKPIGYSWNGAIMLVGFGILVIGAIAKMAQSHAAIGSGS